MFETGESSEEPKPARVLVDIPNESLPMLNEIIKLVTLRFQTLVGYVLQIVPKDILQSIIDSEPQSTIRIIECMDPHNAQFRRNRFASITKKWPTPECLKGVNWQKKMGIPLRDQESHDVCWAIVVSELIRAVRLIENPNQDPKIRYSPQDLIDFSDPVKRREKKEEKEKGKGDHFCYTSNLTNGFKYVMKHGIQLEDDRTFSGCAEEVPDRPSTRLTFIKDYVKLDTIQEALIHLEHRPIGAALALFHPEYKDIGGKASKFFFFSQIYHGPMNHKSTFCGLHAVSLVRVGEENGEKYVLARSSHGDKFGCEGGYIKISLEVMLAYIPIAGERINKYIEKYFGKPRYLLRRFSYPRLLTEEEEEIKRNMYQDKDK
ncbi:hypothetical protein HID58_082282 [Brassica napus]|uniref:Peptidase C1A papain C-terminal domain-containing protein n=1 Tax=Brassica napus TaxID=3708 RepID=A0ABQ7YA21_BRANA|nr:hypothetical protein HID58_082282 [Brassica napus]